MAHFCLIYQAHFITTEKIKKKYTLEFRPELRVESDKKLICYDS